MISTNKHQMAMEKEMEKGMEIMYEAVYLSTPAWLLGPAKTRVEVFEMFDKYYSRQSDVIHRFEDIRSDILDLINYQIEEIEFFDLENEPMWLYEGLYKELDNRFARIKRHLQSILKDRDNEHDIQSLRQLELDNVA